MSETFMTQCHGCGALYNDLQDACPYCGEPQPDFVEDDPDPSQIYVEPPVVNGPADIQSYLLPQEPDLDDYEDDEPLAGTAFEDDPYHDLDDHPGYTADYRQYTMPSDSYLPYDDDEEAYPEQFAGGYVEPYPEDESYPEPFVDEYAEADEAYHHYGAPDAAPDFAAPAGEPDAAPTPRRFTWRRIALGCVSMLVCLGLLYGGIALMAVRQGLTERAVNIQSESEEHYEKGQEHLADNSIDLAIAEFQMALSINPNFTEARQALQEAQQVVQSKPSPTSETRSAAAAEQLAEAQVQVDRENWAEAAEILSQVRDLDPDYEAEEVSELIYQANYELGLQLAVPNKLTDAVAAFERALAERPDDPEALAAYSKASLYLAGLTALEENQNLDAVEQFSQLYEEDATYLDVRRRLRQVHELAGDELAETGDWCLAEVQYEAANTLRFSEPLQAKLDESISRCEEEDTLTQTANPTPRATAPAGREVVAAAVNDPDDDRPASPTATPTADTAAFTPPQDNTGGGNGLILFSAFNQNELRWEILSVPAGGGSPKALVINGTMPALSPNGQMLLYHSELIDSEGFHILDLTTGEDRRVTLRKRHILPRWGGSNSAFILVAEEPGTGRWQIQQGFADGKSEPIILHDGRTPDWSPDGSTIAYQGTNPQGNEPGIYLIPFSGGETKRLTDHESDRLPMFSPNGSQLAYMSTRAGNWDIYVIDAAGGTPRQLTTYPGNDGLPAWSPDGTQIAYVSDAGGRWGIYTISAQGGEPTRLTDWDGNRHPDWLLAQIWWTR
jgi:tetratricopeptide (TPR) repeat protein